MKIRHQKVGSHIKKASLFLSTLSKIWCIWPLSSDVSSFFPRHILQNWVNIKCLKNEPFFKTLNGTTHGQKIPFVWTLKGWKIDVKMIHFYALIMNRTSKNFILCNNLSWFFIHWLSFLSQTLDWKSWILILHSLRMCIYKMM